MSPQRLVFGLLLSSEWIITTVFLIVAGIATVVFQVVQFAFSALIPLAIGVVTMVSRRVISMFNFTLAESPRGLRITRGLTNLTSQSVPINRLQGVRVSQPLLWKAVGWYRVDVDVVGYSGSSDGENNESQATNVLLPVASRVEVDLALSRALPGFDLDGIELHPVPAAGALVALVRLVDAALRLGRPGPDHRARLDDPLPRYRAARQDAVGSHRAGALAASAAAC